MFILDPFALATDGTLAPASGGGYCLQPFALASSGQFVIDVEALGLADPYRGPNRFNEPFDRGYYLWRYGPEIQGPARPPIARSLVEQQLLRDRPVMDAITESRRLQENIAERDQLELETYIDVVNAEIESGLLQRMAELEDDRRRQQALIARLEENRVAARDVLLLVIDQRRRHRNQQIAAMAAIEFFY